jgi:flavorubredoxin
MPVTNAQTNTRIDEIADRIFRISTPVPPNRMLPAGFTFNQFLILDDEPVMFHTGMRKLFPLVREAMATVMPVEKLRWISWSHWEVDESGSLAEWLAAAPNAQPLVGQISYGVNAGDADREARMLADGETIAIGDKRVRWLDAPHLPHGWDSGFLFEASTRTLFCGDIFTQPGDSHAPVTESEVLGPSEAMRAAMDYYSNPHGAATLLERLASNEPALLACMHGASYRGNGAAALRELASTLVK